MLLYSADNRLTWLPIQTELSATTYSFDTSRLQGGDQVWFRVLASDGIHTTTADTGPVSLTLSPALGPLPASVTFPTTSVGTTQFVTLKLTNTGSGYLTVSNLASDNPAFSWRHVSSPLIIGPGSSYSMRLSFRPATAGVQTGHLTITLSGGPVVAPVTLTGSGSATAVARAQVAPDSLDFGTVVAGQAKDLSIQLTNAGAATLHVGALSATGGAFSLPSSAAFTVAPAASRSVTVHFSPSAAQVYSGTLTLTTDDPDNRTITVNLGGTGTPVASGARPTFTAAAVVNGASFKASLSRCSLATIFGSNLATSTAQAPSLPLPTALGGAQVSIGGKAAPLVWVSPTQLNLQVPCDAPLSGSVAVTVTTAAGISDSQSLRLGPYAPGVFTYATASGALNPIIVHVDNTLVTSDRPAAAGEVLIVYATGVGNLNHLPTTGTGSPQSPLSTAVDLPAVTVGGASAAVLFAGLTPGFVGLSQINVQLPATLPAGSSLPLVATFAGAASPPVNLAVQTTHNGGPPPGGILVSDSFNRADASGCSLGRADQSQGGSGSHYYLPIFPSGVSTTVIRSGGLENTGLDYGGVQLTASAACGGRGETFPQDLDISVDVLVPRSDAGIVQAGPYFRSRAAASGDGIIGGTSAGYWVYLTSGGDVYVKMLNPPGVIAISPTIPSFDPSRFHSLRILGKGTALGVYLDGSRVTFAQNGAVSQTVTLPESSGSNDGTVGIAFGAETVRGKVGGQRARNLVIATPAPD